MKNENHSPLIKQIKVGKFVFFFGPRLFLLGQIEVAKDNQL